MAGQKHHNEQMNVEDALTQSEAFLIKNKKAIIGGVVAVIIIVAGVIMYKHLCYAQLGQYDEAIKYLTEFDGKDQMVGPAVLAAAGNCYAQKNELDKAVAALLKAADKADSNTLSPIYLLQAGEILIKQGKAEEAIKAYTQIKDKYFQSYQAMDIDKYIEQAKLLKK